ncbi:hypothetical protein EES47_24880 [Streptomyces sp. ADI98-12]|nr:hypothetical protein EES47_24880 [Streptomyces sp. ADI98-12]
MFEGGASGGQGVADVERARAGDGGHAGELRVKGVARLRGHRPGDDGGRRDGCGRRGRRGLVRLRGLLDDDVGVGAADPEGGDAGAARPAGPGPGGALGEQADVARGPVDVAGRLVDVEGLGQDPVLKGEDGLDHARDTGGGLGVADVRLHRAEQQRPVLGAVLPVRRQQRLRLDRVAQRSTRAVRLDRVHVGGGEPRAGQCLADDTLLGGAVGGGEAVGGAVLVHGGAAHHGQHLVAVAAGVGEPLQDEDAGALGPAGAVGGVGERLAAPAGGDAALAGEAREAHRGGHHGDAAREGEAALAVAQRLGRQVDGDERGRARGVDGDGGPREVEGVRQAAGDHAGGEAGGGVALGVLTGVHDDADVVDAGRADVDAGAAAAQGDRVDAGPFHRLPGGLQQDPLLGVHGDGLAGRDAEEARVERGGVDETALARGAAARALAVQRVEVPAAVGGERRDAVAALVQETPVLLGGVDAAGQAAGHADDRDGFAPVGLRLLQPPAGLVQIGRDPLEVVDELVVIGHDVGNLPVVDQARLRGRPGGRARCR